MKTKFNKISLPEEGKMLTRSELKSITGGLLAPVPNCSSGPCSYLHYDSQGREITTPGSCEIQITSGGVTEKDKYKCYCSASGPIPVNYNGISHCQLS